MQTWATQRGLCYVCSLRALARESIARQKRPLTSTSVLSRNRAHERIGKGRWKEGVVMRTVPLDGESKSKKSKAEIHGHLLPSGSGPHIPLELQRVRDRLVETASDGEGDQHGPSMDPDLVLFEQYHTKVKEAFEAGRKDQTADDFIAPLKEALLLSFKEKGRAAFRKALQFGYYDFIASLKNVKPKDLQTPQYLDLRYPAEWYHKARQMQRQIHLHVGPTNSGKTYHALKRLEEAGDGMYGGPLRLLAFEVWNRFQSKGVPCNLITGDDVRTSEDEARLSSHTVEMFDIGRRVEVAVIDEIQMIASEDRGWAWSRALLGAQAKELHLCGEARVVPLIQDLAGLMGDKLQIHRYERLNPLKAMARSLRGNLKALRPGDCVVSFSVIHIHALKKQIELDTGRRVAVVYGSLPPQIRSQQAALFNDPNNDYDFLVASDAIGMGLNLSIKRIIFESIMRNDGRRVRKLTVSEIKQIGGRAGRYRPAEEAKDGESRLTSYAGTAKPSNVGLVTCLDERDLHDIQVALGSEAPPISAAGIMAPVEHLEALSNSLPRGVTYEYLLHTISKRALTHPRFFLCNTETEETTAEFIENIRPLTIVQQAVMTAAPVDSRSEIGIATFKALTRCVAQRKAVTVLDVPEIPLDLLDQPMTDGRQYLKDLESLHKALIVFLWLSYRFRNVLEDQDLAFRAKELVEERINTRLLTFSTSSPLAAKLRRLMKAGDRLLQNKDGESDTDPTVESESTDQQPGNDGQPTAKTVRHEGPLTQSLDTSLRDAPALTVNWEKDSLKGDLGAEPKQTDERQSNAL